MTMDWDSRQENVITVVATGEVRARANVMHLILEIRTRGTTATEALQENNARDRAVRLRLRGVGIHEESVETSGVSFLPAAGDGVTLPGTMEPQGFLAVRTLSINAYLHEDEVSQLPARIARVLDEASEGGAQAGARQQVNLAIFRSPCVTYALDNDEVQRSEALRRAMLAARAAAEETARSINAELDSIVSTQILELGGLVQSRWTAAAFSMPGLDTPRPVEAGRVHVRAVVAVTYGVHHASPARERDRERLGAQYTLEAHDTTRPGHPGHTPELS